MANPSKANDRVSGSTWADFDQDWLFKPDAGDSARFPEISDRDWQRVAIPHHRSFSDEDSRSSTTLASWYRRHVSLPADTKGKIIHLVVEGPVRESKVWVNGHAFNAPLKQSNRYEYDITTRINAGFENDNVIAILHSPSPSDRIQFPGSTPTAGIWLKVLNPVHLVATSFKAEGPTILPTGARIRVKAEIANLRHHQVEIILRNQLFGPEDVLIGQTEFAVSVAAETNSTVTNEMVIPYLSSQQPSSEGPFRIATTLIESDQTVDEIETISDQANFFNPSLEPGEPITAN